MCCWYGAIAIELAPYTVGTNQSLGKPWLEFWRAWLELPSDFALGRCANIRIVVRDTKYGFLTTMLWAPSSYGPPLVGGYRPYTGGSQHAVIFEGFLLHVGLRGSAADVTIG